MFASILNFLANSRTKTPLFAALSRVIARSFRERSSQSMESNDDEQEIEKNYKFFYDKIQILSLHFSEKEKKE